MFAKRTGGILGNPPPNAVLVESVAASEFCSFGVVATKADGAFFLVWALDLNYCYWGLDAVLAANGAGAVLEDPRLCAIAVKMMSARKVGSFAVVFLAADSA